MSVAAHLYISGRVQGVFFRYETQSKAIELGVKGWVKNLSDGRVKVVVEGDQEAVQKLIEFCQHGPPGAKVTNLVLEWGIPTNKYESFKVEY